MRTLRPKLMIALWAFIAVSCTFESNRSEDCISNVTLRLNYIDKNGVEHFDDYLQNTDVYLFKESDNTFIRKYSFTKAQSLDPAGIQVMLPAGNYHMITWVNVGARTEITPANPAVGTSASAFSLNLINPTQMHPTADTIFYNHVDFQIQNAQSQTIPVPLRRETCYIHVLLSGYDQSREPYIVMDNLTNGYNFDDLIQGDVVNYGPDLLWKDAAGVFEANYAVLRPKDTDDIHIHLYDNTQTAEIMQLDLTAPLKAQSIDLEKDIEPELTVKLKVLPGNQIEVNVNDWHAVVDIHVDL